MRRLGRLALGLAVALAWGSVASATPTLNVVGGSLHGAYGVDVGGTLYDVEFVDGFGAPTNCAPFFDGCDEAGDFAFTDSTTGQAALQALLDQVFIDQPLGQFDSNPDLTSGCGGGLHCAVFTPGVLPFTGANPSGAMAAINFDGTSADQVRSDFPFSDVSVFDRYHTWARWSPAAVPEPTTGLLLGLGLLGVAVRRRV